MPKSRGQSFVILEGEPNTPAFIDTYPVFAWLEGHALYWKKKLDTLHIFEEALERSVKGLINGFLLLFGLLGLGALGVTIYAVLQEGGQIGDVFLRKNGLMGIFAISLLSDLYAYYRMSRESLLDRSVMGRSFDPILTDENPVVILERLQADRATDWIDVSQCLTPNSQRHVEDAWQLARKLRHAYVVPLHLTASLLNHTDTKVVLGRLGVDGKALVERISRGLGRIPVGDGRVAIGSTFLQVVLRSYAEAYYDRRSRIDVAQLLTALIQMDAQTQEIFYDLEIEQQDIINAVEWINIQHRLAERWSSQRMKAAYKSKGVMNKSMTAQATPLLDRFSSDLTQLARRGVLPPTIGRDRELDEVLRIIEGGKNVILAGNPGVGKTSIVEGIAEMMATEEVPEVLQDRRFVSLSVASLVGAAGRQGELEALFLQIINEVVRSGNIVMFIDNIQNMVGVSTQGAENMDIAAMLANALSKRLFFCIATTTTQDYRRYIEGSSSLTSVFQKVQVLEPDTNGAIQILQGKASGIEAKNEIFFSYQSIRKTVEFSERYIHDRYLPEKAIALLEEIGVYVRKKRGKNSIVTTEDVAEIVSNKTNVPVTKLTQQETEKLLNMEQLIHERMVDQEEAVSAVATALRRARAELRDLNRPIVNLLFLGPTGVGKTELAKTVADIYFGAEENMIRLDMSEYQEQASINRLIGAPPGYSGGGQGGFLTEAVRAQPFSLVLLDEIEKAHPDILNVFLQVMDDGRLTDTLGRTIDFTNTIIIATSNAGSQLIQDRIREKATLEGIRDELINQALKPYFRPEFLNRFDNIVVFKPLAMEDIIQIVDLMLKQVAKRLALKGIRLEASAAAKEELAREGFDPVFGARPLRRAIQDKVDNALATYLLQGRLSRRDVAVLEVGGRISVRQAEAL
ncbi:MAG: ATP-dependent Clp protease ATP-binding subunit [Candidatus Kerfeldbacteria bacterium]|nr:ATP-dependent Clp protease ATP-binding subunit [Candidatus Kerfeldbacteria bacterium]